jgi:ABC-2 type transport system ATP-binding protein
MSLDATLGKTVTCYTRQVGVIPQHFTFVDKSTPRETVKYYAKIFGVRVDIDKILKEVLLEDAANVLFENLSGGQKQKMGLALSLVNSPELLFLDEPTTNARRAVWDVIRKFKTSGRTIILTTHYLEEAENLSDRVAIMDHGRIIAMGTSDEIIALTSGLLMSPHYTRNSSSSSNFHLRLCPRGSGFSQRYSGIFFSALFLLY